VARRIRSSQVETRTQRLKLQPRRQPYTVRVADGVRLAYRRLETTAGSWSVQVADGKGGSWLQRFADADDYEEANSDTVLNFWQAQDRARELARGKDSDAVNHGKPTTVAGALDSYEADLRIRGADVAAVPRVRLHLAVRLLVKGVAHLTPRELRQFRDTLAKKGAAGTADRICNALRAALNLAADTDQRITSRAAWEIGLKGIYDATEARNVILPPDTVHRIVEEAYSISPEFGLLVETVATTGVRVVSQAARLEVQDVQNSPWRLMMPSSKKGRGQKKVLRRPVPIPESLAICLRQAGQGRAEHAPLLLKPNGEPWRKSHHARLFARAVEQAGLDSKEVTIYALRHSSIVRQLLANVPIRVVAINHDTSIAMIEKTYSKYIGDHADAVTRPALLEFSRPALVSKVVPLAR
jgi:hypothetical protein